jgi:hypothetical protein
MNRLISTILLGLIVIGMQPIAMQASAAPLVDEQGAMQIAHESPKEMITKSTKKKMKHQNKKNRKPSPGQRFCSFFARGVVGTLCVFAGVCASLAGMAGLFMVSQATT